MVAVIIVVVILVVVIGAFVAFFRWNRHRRAELKAGAAARGWTYAEGGGGDWMSVLPSGSDEGLPGPNLQGVSEQLSGSSGGLPVTAADYWKLVPAGGSDGLTPAVIQASVDGDLPAGQVQGAELIVPWSGVNRADDLDQRVGQALALATALEA